MIHISKLWLLTRVLMGAYYKAMCHLLGLGLNLRLKQKQSRQLTLLHTRKMTGLRTL